jgi:hypothetical protein
MTTVESSKTADSAAVVTWTAWGLSHLAEANAVLQFIVLCIALVSGIYALAFHYTRYSRLESRNE